MMENDINFYVKNYVDLFIFSFLFFWKKWKWSFIEYEHKFCPLFSQLWIHIYICIIDYTANKEKAEFSDDFYSIQITDIYFDNFIIYFPSFCLYITFKYLMTFIAQTFKWNSLNQERQRKKNRRKLSSVQNEQWHQIIRKRRKYSNHYSFTVSLNIPF